MMEGVSGQLCFMVPKSPMTPWQSMQDIPIALQGVATVVIGQQVYLIGGLDVNNNTLSTVYVYNTQSDSWTTLSSINSARAFAYAAINSDGSKLFVFGGLTVSGLGGFTDVQDIEVYDVSLNKVQFNVTMLSDYCKWEVFPTQMTTLHRRGSIAQVGGTLYFFGGG
jgi:N-acetylneuraminic acid mutarotase